MATTIREMASKLNIAPKKLLSEFSKKFPEQSWNLDSETPEGFEQAASSHAQDYAEASGVELPKGELTTLPDAIKDNKLILESIEYGIVEAIAQLRTQSLVHSAKVQALQDIQLTESAYNSVWEQYFESKVETTRKRKEVNEIQATDASIALNTELGKRQASIVKKQVLLTDLQKQNTTDIENAINALFQ